MKSYRCERCEVAIGPQSHQVGCPCIHAEHRCATCKRRRRNARANRNRKAREAILRSCGLVKVRGALGGIYWE